MLRYRLLQTLLFKKQKGACIYCLLFLPTVSNIKQLHRLEVC